MKSLRIGLIGAGRWMRWYHLPTIGYLGPTEGVVPVVIWNRTQQKARELAAEFGIQNVAESVHDLLTNYGIDGVIIAVSREITPTIIHAVNAAKIPFLVEKPPADGLDQARELDRIVTVPHLVAFNRVFSPIMQELKAIASKSNPYHMSCIFSRRHRTDSKFVFETGVHALANGHFFFGSGQLISTRKSRIDEKIMWWNATVAYESGPLAPNGITVEYSFAPWSGRAVERYNLIGPETTIDVFVQQHYAPDDEERIEISMAVDDELQYSTWTPGSIPELERAGYAEEHRTFYRLARKQLEGVFPDIHRTAELMSIADQINENI